MITAIRRNPYAGVTFPEELYDLKADLRETVNRHNDPALKSVVGKLSAELDQFSPNTRFPATAVWTWRTSPSARRPSPG